MKKTNAEKIAERDAAIERFNVAKADFKQAVEAFWESIKAAFDKCLKST